MLSAGFVTPLIPSWGEAVAGSPPTHGSSSLTRQLRNASAAFVAVAGMGCDVSTLPMNIHVVAAADGAGMTSMACSPPRSHTRIANYTRQLTVPTAALASSKTRRKRRGSGGGGGGDDDFGGDDGFFGGGDDGFGNGGGGDDGREGPSDDSMGRWLQDVILLWTVFCAWSTWNVLQHVTKTNKTPSPCLAAVSMTAAAVSTPPLLPLSSAS